MKQKDAEINRLTKMLKNFPAHDQSLLEQQVVFKACSYLRLAYVDVTNSAWNFIPYPPRRLQRKQSSLRCNR